MLSSSSLLDAFIFSLFLSLRRYIPPPPPSYTLSLFSLSPSYSLSFSSSLFHAFSFFFLPLTRYLTPPRSYTRSLFLSLTFLSSSLHLNVVFVFLIFFMLLICVLLSFHTYTPLFFSLSPSKILYSSSLLQVVSFSAFYLLYPPLPSFIFSNVFFFLFPLLKFYPPLLLVRIKPSLFFSLLHAF